MKMLLNVTILHLGDNKMGGFWKLKPRNLLLRGFMSLGKLVWVLPKEMHGFRKPKPVLA